MCSFDKTEKLLAQRGDWPNAKIMKKIITYFLLNSFWQIEHKNIFAGSIPPFRFSPKWMRRRCSFRLYFRVNASEHSSHLKMRSLVCSRKWHRSEFLPKDRLQIGHGILSPFEIFHLCSISWKMHSASVGVLRLEKMSEKMVIRNDSRLIPKIALFASPKGHWRVRFVWRLFIRCFVIAILNRIRRIFQHLDAVVIDKCIAWYRCRAFVRGNFRGCHRLHFKMRCRRNHWHSVNVRIYHRFAANFLLIFAYLIANVATQFLRKYEFLTTEIASAVDSSSLVSLIWSVLNALNLRIALVWMQFSQMLLQQNQIVQHFTAYSTFSLQRLLFRPGMSRCHLMLDRDTVSFGGGRFGKAQPARTA